MSVIFVWDWNDIPNRPSIFEWFFYDAQWFSQIFTDCHWLSRDFQWFIFVRVATDPNLATQVKGILSVIGGNKNLKTIIRGVMRHLMSKELRMGYVTRKPTSGKKTFTAHKNLSTLVLGKSITFYLTLKNSVVWTILHTSQYFLSFLVVRFIRNLAKLLKFMSN